jgi:mono/diheme cytochrome c family protein
MTGVLMRRLLAAAAFVTLATPARADMPLQTLYTLNCSGCHGAKGQGVPEAGIPNLNDAGRYIRTELGRKYLIQVPGLSQSRLDDATAARLLNWVLLEFSANRLPADFTPYTTEEVTRFRSDKASDAKTRRDAILAELRSRGLLESGYDPATSAAPVRN